MTPEAAYTFADIVARSGATPRQLAHWTSKAVGIITPSVRTSAGRGDPRLFGPFNLLQAKVGALLSGWKVPAPTLRWIIGRPLLAAYEAGHQYLLVPSVKWLELAKAPAGHTEKGRHHITSMRYRYTQTKAGGVFEETVISANNLDVLAGKFDGMMVLNLTALRQTLDL